MRKTNYNSLRETEAVAIIHATKLPADAKVNKPKMLRITQWLIGLFILAFSFTANAQISVTSSGGTGNTSPLTHTTLKSAFDSINNGYYTGVISISVTASTTETATANLNSSGGTSSYTSVEIKPATGVTATIGGNLAGAAVIKLTGADNVTIDGSNTVGGSTRDLSIKNSSTSTSGNTGIWVGAASSNGANNVTIKNCDLTQANTGVTNSTCVFLGSATTYFSASLAASKNLTLTNNYVARAARGLMVLGSSSTPDTNLVINNNTVDSINLSSMYLQAQREFNIYDNYWDYKNTSSAATAEGNAIHIVGASANGNIYRNNIYKIRHNGTVQTRGVSLNSTASSPNISVFNNFFGDIWNPGISNAFSIYGLRIDNATGGVKVYHNSFNLTTGMSNSTAVSTCLGIVGTTTANSIDIRNNIFRNTQNGGGNAYAIAFLSASASVWGTMVLNNCNNNAYYSTSPNYHLNTIASNGSQSAASTLSAIQASSGKDANSVVMNPQFVSTTDLHLQAIADNASLNNGGVALGAVTTDFDGAARSTNAPDIGADEIIYTPKITSFSPSSACPGSTVTINGADFIGASAVSLAGLAASSFTVVSTSQITAVVANSATPSVSVITITNASGTATSSTNLDRKSPGTFVSKSLSTGSVGDQVTISGTNLTGATTVAFNGTSTSFTISNSAEIVATVPSVANNTYAVTITDACGNSISAGNFTVVAANVCATPSSQATNFVASSTTSSTLNGTFTAAGDNPSGYLVVYSAAPLSGVPQDGSTYNAGAGFSGTILQVSSSNSVAITGLTPNTSYTVTIFAFNGGGCTSGPKYNTSSPLTYTFTTCSGVPTSITATAVGSNSGNSIDFSWGAPTGGGANGVTYELQVYTDAAMTTAVSGSPFTTNQTTQSVSGLTFNTTYYYRIRSNNGCNGNWVTGSATSGCGATTVPFFQNFDATITSALPTCWTTEDVNGDGITWTSANIDSRVTGLSNPRALRYLANTSTTSVAANDWAFMPGLQLTGGQSYTLSFLQNALSNSSEGLQVYVGGVANSSIKINANKIFDNSTLSNTAAALRTATFTPATTGVYYVGFYCNSPSNAAGGLFLFLDDISFDATPGAPVAPSPVTTSNATAYSIQVNWNDNSGSEYGHRVYSSLDGTTWILRTSLGANVTSAVISNLKASTSYWFKVEAYNAGGSNSATTATSSSTGTCSGYTTNSYIGSLFLGTGNNWNNGANWSQGHAPTACEDVQINGTLTASTTTLTYIYLPNAVAVHDFTISQTFASLSRQRMFVWTQGNSFDISGNMSISGNGTNVSDTITSDGIYVVGGTGNVTVDGNLSIGTTGNRFAAIGSAFSDNVNYTVKGNVTFGPQAFINGAALTNLVLDAPSAQTVNLNAAQAGGTGYGIGYITVGATNTPTVTFTDTLGTNTDIQQVVNDFTINAGCSVIIGNGTNMNRSQSGSGTFTMGNNSSLTISGASGGVGSSNFPSGFGVYSLANSSTVIYNGTAAQTIASTPVYGNLTLNNTNGATLNGNATVNNVLTLTNGKISTGANQLTLGLNASLVGASSSNYINGTLAKTKTADTNGALNFEIGDATQYTPVFVGFNGVTNSGGIFSAKTTSGAPAALGYLRSGISLTNYLNRSYTLKNNGVTGYTSFAPKFSYSNGDIIGGGDNTGFKVADSIYGGGWTIRTTNNASDPYSQAIGVTALGSSATADYLIGELDAPPAPTVDALSPTSVCEGSNYVVTGTNFYGVTGVTIGGSSCSFTVNSSTQITIAIPSGSSNGAVAVTNAGGTGTSSNSLTTLDQPQTTVGTSSQTVCSGVAITTIVLGNSNSVAGTTYSWTRTGNNSAISGATSGSSDISGTLTSTSTISETLTYTVNSTGGNGCAGVAAIATVTVKASPGTVSLSPSSAAICQNSVQQITANYTAATGDQTSNSGVISVEIPDGTGTNGINGLTGVTHDLIMSSVPSGVVVTKIDVGVSVNHTYTGDLGINVKAPNGKILNLAQLSGESTDNFVNTVFSSDADPNTQFLPQDSTPGGITGTYAPDGYNNVGTPGFRSNTTNFSDLFATPNGTWKLIVRDYGGGDTGQIVNWYVKVYYTLSPTFVWAPTSGLYLDAGHNTAYSGGSQQTVYAYNNPGTYNYSANISFDGCTTSSSAASIDIQAIPTAARDTASQAICSGSAIYPITLSSPNDNTATLSWTRNHTSDVTGMASSGTGNISGTLVNTTSAPITVTFTVTANGSGSQTCAGTSVTSTVTVNPVPLASVSPSSQNVCTGTAINPLIFNTTNGVGGTTFAWTRNNTSAATGIAASGTSFVSGILTNASGNTTVTFSVTAVGPSPSFCAGTPTTATVNVLNPATVYSVTGGGNFCSPATAGIGVGLSNSQSGYSYQLYKDGSASGSPVAGTGSAISFGLQSEGTYTVVAGNGGCSTNMTGSVTVTSTSSAAASITISTATTTVCSGSNVTFSSSISNGGSSPTYTWRINGGVVGTSSSTYVAPSGSLSTNDQITCELTSSNTCATPSSALSNTIILNVTPSPYIAPITDGSTNASSRVMCTLGTTANFYCSTSGGTWSSSASGIASVYNASGTSTVVVTAVSNGVAIVSYSMPPVNGCASSSSVIINVSAVPTPGAVTGSSTMCVANSTTYTTSSTGGVWSTAGRATITSGGVATGTSAGSTSIKYTVTNADGCSAFSTKTVTVNAQPAVPSISFAPGTTGVTGSGGYCMNKTFTVVGKPTGGAWSKTGVITMPNAPSGGLISTGPSAGPFSVTYTVTDANGCTNFRTISSNIVSTCNSRGVVNNAIASDNNFTMYPNPTKNLVSLQLNKLVGDGQIIVTNLLGKQVIVQPLSMGTNNVDVSKLSKGYYLVSVVTSEGKTTQRLVKE